MTITDARLTVEVPIAHESSQFANAVSASPETVLDRSGTTRGRYLRYLRPVSWVFIGGLWLFLVGLGLARLWQYKSAPGEIAAPPAVWPAASRLLPRHGKATLVMTAHPHCVCTRASIAELAKLMTQLGDRVAAFVLFVRPQNTSDAWVETDTWRSAAGIPGVSVVRDEDGAGARLFGAFTSGQTFLYSVDGRLLFNGGITGARGHEGDNPGASRIVSLVTRGSAELSDAPVFGCELQDPSGSANRRGGSP